MKYPSLNFFAVLVPPRFQNPISWPCSGTNKETTPRRRASSCSARPPGGLPVARLAGLKSRLLFSTLYFQSFSKLHIVSVSDASPASGHPSVAQPDAVSGDCLGATAAECQMSPAITSINSPGVHPNSAAPEASRKSPPPSRVSRHAVSVTPRASDG